MNEFDWRADVLTPLKNNDLILVLGPEFNNMREKITSHVKEDAEIDQYVYDYNSDSNIYIFKKDTPEKKCKAAVSDITDRIKNYLSYNNQRHPEIYDYIAQIPFSCIINLSPDNFTVRAFNKFEYPKQFGVYVLRQANSSVQNLDLKINNISAPVIYNLFGIYNDHNSLINTYEELMTFFSQIFSKPSIDDKLKEFLKTDNDNAPSNAKQFIFLGFRYESWHLQLIMQLLNIHKHREPENLNLRAEKNPIVLQQVEQYFHLNNQLFDEKDFIKKMFEECKQRGADYIRYMQIPDFWKRVEPLWDAGFVDETFAEMQRRNTEINYNGRSLDLQAQLNSLYARYKEAAAANNREELDFVRSSTINLSQNFKENFL